MTEENKKPTFKAPPLPPKGIQMPAHKTDVSPTAAPVKIASKQVEGLPAPVVSAEGGKYDNNFAAEFNLSPKILETKVMASIAAGVLFFGIMVGCAMFGGSSKTVQTGGLGDIIYNPDIKYALPRCGQTDPNRACVLYIMNAKTYDRLGNDFFQEAQNITGVPKYSIQISNVLYANKLIRPGFIAQIYIPARN